MPLVEHNDVIEAFPSNRPDDAFSEGILPGRPRGDEDLAHPQGFHPLDERVAVDGISIAEEVIGRRLFWETLDQLVSGPSDGGVVGNVDVDEFSTVVSKDQESEEQQWPRRPNSVTGGRMEFLTGTTRKGRRDGQRFEIRSSANPSCPDAKLRWPVSLDAESSP
jgi:hypothetical protein